MLQHEKRIQARFLILPTTLPLAEAQEGEDSVPYETRWLCHTHIEQEKRGNRWIDRKWSDLPQSGEFSRCRPLFRFKAEKPANA